MYHSSAIHDDNILLLLNPAYVASDAQNHDNNLSTEEAISIQNSIKLRYPSDRHRYAVIL